MQNCPYCNAPLNEKYNFCVNCDRQIKCVYCSEFLVPNKTRCYVCGKPIENEDASPSIMNEFTLEEKHTRTSSSRSLKGRFSDATFSQATSLINGLPLSKPIQVVQAKSPSYHQPALPHIDEPGNELPDVPTDESEQVNSAVLPSQQPVDKIARYFERDGADTLVPLVSDYKGENKKEQQQRFMLLYTYAYNHIFNHPVPDSKHIFTALKARGMLDGNSYGHFPGVENKYLIKGEAGYRVNYDGNKEVERIINEIEDNNKKGFTDWDKPGKSRAKQSRMSKQDEERLNRWVNMTVDLEGFNIRLLKSPTNYAMFAIYVLTKKLEVVKAVKSVVIFHYLTKKYTAIPVTQKSINRALRRPYNASIFEKTADVAYYLTIEGEKKVKDWLQGGKIEDVSESELEDDTDDNEENDEE